MARNTDPRCGRSWSGLKAEHCTVCHETFTNTSAGDAHRVGKHGVTTGPDRRRCLPVSEVKRRDSKDKPPYGLKWNPKVQAWGWDSPKPAFFERRDPQNSGAQGNPGTEYRGASQALVRGVR